MFASLKGENFQANLKQLDTKLQELIKATPSASSQIATSSKSFGESGVQLCADYYDGAGLLGLVFRFQGFVDKNVADLAKPENKDEKHQKDLNDGIANLKAALQLLFCTCACLAAHNGRLTMPRQ